jgi:hypothetical protein
MRRLRRGVWFVSPFSLFPSRPLGFGLGLFVPLTLGLRKGILVSCDDGTPFIPKQ